MLVAAGVDSHLAEEGTLVVEDIQQDLAGTAVEVVDIAAAAGIAAGVACP